MISPDLVYIMKTYQPSSEFHHGNSESVHVRAKPDCPLAEKYRVSGNELTISRVGRSLVLTPIKPEWTDFFNMPDQFESDKPIERNQPQEQQGRDPLADK